MKDLFKTIWEGVKRIFNTAKDPKNATKTSAVAATVSTVGTVIGNPGFIAATLVQPLVGLSILGVTFSVVFLVSYGTILLANDTVTFEQA